MYKITIQETIGQVSKKTTVETDDVDLVKAMLQMKQDVYVHSDVDNLNIDPEWQELMQWYREQKAKNENDKTPDTVPGIKEWLEQQDRKRQETKPSPFPQPYVNPFTKPFDPYSPFTVTC